MRLFRAVMVLVLATSVAPLGACSLDVDKGVRGPEGEEPQVVEGTAEARLVRPDQMRIPDFSSFLQSLPSESYNDGQIMGVMLASSGGEIFLGETMQQRARDEAVRQYAREMVVDHTALMQQLASLSQASNIPPTQSDVIGEIQQDNEAFQQVLQQRRGSIDDAYLESQVRSHQRLAELIDSEFLPQADNPELNAALEFSLEMVSLHLQRAQYLLETLSDASSGNPAEPRLPR